MSKCCEYCKSSYSAETIPDCNWKKCEKERWGAEKVDYAITRKLEILSDLKIKSQYSLARTHSDDARVIENKQGVL